MKIKKQVEEHSDLINKLFVKVGKINDKIAHIPKTYHVHLQCSNCREWQWFYLPKGEERPKKWKCENCGCEVFSKLEELR